MAVEYWYPISAATHDLPYDAWTLGAGANKNAATRIGGGRAGPVTHDDDTSYVNATGAQRQAFNIDWPGPIVAWSGLTAGFRLKETAVAAQTVSQEFANITPTLSGTFNTTDPGGYATVGPIDVAAYRPTGGTWVPSDFKDDKTTFATVVSNATAVVVTSVFGQMTYTPPAGGFVFLLGLAGAMALRGVGVIPDFSHFMRFLEWRRAFHPRHTILDDKEIADAWINLRTYRWPTYFYGGHDAYAGCTI